MNLYGIFILEVAYVGFVFFVSVFLFLFIFVIVGVDMLALFEHSNHLLFFRKQIFILQACLLLQVTSCHHFYNKAIHA